MKDISLKDLLEAGCHFGHKVERWHPKAVEFIYTEREGLHIIDLAKTRDGLKKAADFLRDLAKEGKLVLYVATKRQAKGVVTDAAKRAGVPYLTNRWIGGFVTNWEQVVKNIQKLNTMRKERTDGAWNKFPKHEIVQLEKILRKKEAVYSGVADLTAIPSTIFIVDIKKEVAALREAAKYGMKIVAIVDTNTDPNSVDYGIPANDDSVGSIKYVVDFLSEAYIEGRNIALKQVQGKGEKKEVSKNIEHITDNKEQEKTEEKEGVKDTSDGGKLKRSQSSDSSEGAKRAEKPRKRGRPKKSSSTN